MGFNIKAEKPVSGIIISPDSKTYSFTDVTNGTVVTPRRVSGDYLVVFSGATIETETRYALGIGIEADGYFGGFTQTGRYEPNNTESATVSLSEQKIMAYLYKNDIDYYRVSYGNFNVPPAPTNVSASAADAHVRVSWNAVTGAQSYNVYRVDSQTGAYTKVGTSTTASYTETVARVGTYYYRISAVSTDGFESARSAPTAAAVTGPSAPTNVSASVADAQVTVSWTAVTEAKSYNVYRSDSQTGTYTKVGASTTASYVDTVARAGTYYYKMGAVGASGFESAHSVSTTVTVAGPPAPTNVTTSAADTQVTVSWTTVTEAESYNVYRSDSQTGTYTKVGASTSSPYTETVGAMGTYYYKVSAISASGFESAPSTPTAVAVAGPPAPTGVSASVADAQVTVSWNAVTGASSYNVYRSDSQTGTYTKLGAPTTASYVDTITATGTYYYKVSAMSASDFESALSTPTTVMAGPAVPTNITASAADAQVTVSWTAVTGASSYNVYRSTSQTGTYTKLGAPTTTSYVDTVTATGTYYYKASAVSMGGLESGHSASTTVAVTTIGIDVTSLSETLSWLSSNAVNSTHYTLSLTRDETIPAQTLSYSSMDVTVTLKGKGGERIVSLSGNGSLFTINRGVTLVLEDGVTFKGHSSNNTALVRVNSGGNLVLKDGGEISGNTASYSGGGVYVGGGTFTMSGGEISGNSANIGGGVWVSSSGTFTMSRGEISGNSASAGGGVFVSAGTFTMSGGTISGNTASNGGGVYVYSNGTFTMSGGTISGNTASSSYYFGGGVSVSSNGTFTKQSGGIIYGSDATSALQNTATRGNNYGHAVYVDSSPTRKRNTTAGVGETLDSTKDGSAGGWE
jgi:fibronectin type 3 domain-containing protein